LGLFVILLLRVVAAVGVCGSVVVALVMIARAMLVWAGTVIAKVMVVMATSATTAAGIVVTSAATARLMHVVRILMRRARWRSRRAGVWILWWSVMKMMFRSK
jgi:1-aminocyclopropane-1-carboxylate deaminase/D-cysteine desulfhydrase-like pyridoxal-dependent ACC family enzyme